jgi:hypothetical protein
LFVGKIRSQSHDVRQWFLKQFIANLLRNFFIKFQLDETGGDGFDEFVPFLNNIFSSVLFELIKSLTIVENGF